MAVNFIPQALYWLSGSLLFAGSDDGPVSILIHRDTHGVETAR